MQDSQPGSNCGLAGWSAGFGGELFEAGYGDEGVDEADDELEVVGVELVEVGEAVTEAVFGGADTDGRVKRFVMTTIMRITLVQTAAGATEKTVLAIEGAKHAIAQALQARLA